MPDEQKIRRTTEWCRVDELYIDQEVQRRLRPSHVRYLENAFDLDGVGVITVNERADGAKSVVDGQHRVVALKNLDAGDWKVKCDVYHGGDVAFERRLWRRLNKSVMSTPWEDFRSGLAYGDPECVEIAAIVGRYGFEVSDQTGDGRCAAVATLRRVYAAGVLDDTFGILTASWGTTGEAANSKLVDGIAILCAAHNGAIDRAALTTKLGKTTPAKVIADGRLFKEFNGGSVPRAIARRVQDLYNRGRRTSQLPPL
jgi:hypothetical protein